MQDKLLKQAEEIQKAAVDYVAKAQPIIDEYNAFKVAFAKKAHQTVGALVERRVVAKEDSTKLIEKLASDPSSALELVLSVARRIGVGDGLGKAAEVEYDDSQDGPFERLVKYNDPRAHLSIFD